MMREWYISITTTPGALLCSSSDDEDNSTGSRREHSNIHILYAASRFYVFSLRVEGSNLNRLRRKMATRTTHTAKYVLFQNSELIRRLRVLLDDNDVKRCEIVSRDFKRVLRVSTRKRIRFFDFADLRLKKQRKCPEFKCSKCWLLKEYCLCSKIRVVKSSHHEILVLIHYVEMAKKLASNSAKLIPMCFGEPDSIFTYGNFADELRLSELLAHRNDDDVFVLFPSKDSITTSQLRKEGEESMKGRKRTIIVIDGTWTMAKAMNRCEMLKKYKRIRLTNATRKSHVNMRKHKNQDQVSTLSALIHLFEELPDEHESVISNLSQTHELAVSHYVSQTRSKVVETEDGECKHIKYCGTTTTSTT